MNFITDIPSSVSLLIRTISCVILLVYCIPLQVKEAGVRNGLRVLRLELLLFGVILLVTNTITSYFLIVRIAQNVPQPEISGFLQIVNATAFLILSILGYTIYHTQYTDDIKEAHKKLAEAHGD